MKTINLRGIKESLSEREMKLVKGGVEPAKITEAPPPQTVGQVACDNKSAGDSCSVSMANGSIYKSNCWLDSDGKTKHCGNVL